MGRWSKICKKYLQMVSSKSFSYLRKANKGLHKCCKKLAKYLIRLKYRGSTCTNMNDSSTRSHQEEEDDSLHLVTVVGKRPEITKMSMLVNSLNGRYRNECVFTGQHYSTNMIDIFSIELDIKFDYD